MRKKYNLSNALKEIAKEYSDYEEEVNSIFITVLNDDGSFRMIPYDCENQTCDNSAKTVYFLGNGILKDAEMVALASELAYAKKTDPDEYNKLIEIVENQTNFNKYDTLITLIDEIVSGEVHLDFDTDQEDEDDESREDFKEGTFKELIQ